jgi:2-amino-4-ketopentanoate thiolase alpha subunit
MFAPWGTEDFRRPIVAEPIAPGTWVELHTIVLSPRERAPRLPEDSKRVPLEMRVKGFLLAPALMGEEAEILTPAGRRLRGMLKEVNPAYTHGFGAPIPELSSVGSEARALLRVRGREA